VYSGGQAIKGKRPMTQSTTRRVLGYIRVSTEEQANSGLSLESQRQKLQQYCDLHDQELVDIIEDAGESAKDLQRPGMQRVLKEINNKSVDVVLVVKLDRLTRSTRDLGDLLDRFGRRDVALAAVSESLDTSTAAGRMVVNMIGVVAQWEREAIGERTSAALQVKRQRGERYSGRSPYGWQYVDGRMVENGDEQQTLCLVESMVSNEKLSLRAISSRLADQGIINRNGKPFSASSIKRIIESSKTQRQKAAA